MPLLFPLNFCSIPAYVAHLLHRIDFYRIIYLEQGFCLLCTCNAPHMHYYRTNLIQSVWDFMHRAACSQKSIWPKIPCFCAPSAGSEERETPVGPLLAFPHCHRAAPVPGTGGCLWEGVGASQCPLLQWCHRTWTGYGRRKGGDCAAPSGAAARPWLHTWKRWQMPSSRCFQLPLLPHPSVCIFRCSLLPSNCATETV